MRLATHHRRGANPGSGPEAYGFGEAYSADVTFRWMRQFDPERSDHPASLAVDAAGDTLVAGASRDVQRPWMTDGFVRT